jgi:hypothetical protein
LQAKHLHGFDFLLNRFEHWRVVIDDEIENGVEDVVLAAASARGQLSQRSRTGA